MFTRIKQILIASPARLRDLELDLWAARQLAASYRAQIEANESLIAAHSEQLQSQRLLIDTLEADKAELLALLDAVGDHRDDLQERVDTLDELCSTHLRLTRDLEAQVNDKDTLILDLRNELDNATIELEWAESQFDHDSATLEKMRRQADEDELVIRELEEEILDLRDRLDNEGIAL